MTDPKTLAPEALPAVEFGTFDRKPQKSYSEFLTPAARRSWSKSAVVRTARSIVGPNARLWVRRGRFQLGLEGAQGRVVLGEGADPFDCFYRTFILPIKAREDAAKAQEGP